MGIVDSDSGAGPPPARPCRESEGSPREMRRGGPAPLSESTRGFSTVHLVEKPLVSPREVEKPGASGSSRVPYLSSRTPARLQPGRALRGAARRACVSILESPSPPGAPARRCQASNSERAAHPSRRERRERFEGSDRFEDSDRIEDSDRFEDSDRLGSQSAARTAGDSTTRMHSGDSDLTRI